jgi:hypothetical protein
VTSAGALARGQRDARFASGCSSECASALQSAYGPLVLNASRPRTCCWAAWEGGSSRTAAQLDVYRDEFEPSPDGSTARINRCWVVGPMKEGLSLSRSSERRMRYQKALVRQQRDELIARRSGGGALGGRTAGRG